ncbi:conserved hypothetical protein [Sphingomonas sp. AX6]|nr:conserved hypothetical protein [Sphingomonas sp. AX6]
MAITVAILVFAGALAFTLWTIHATLADKSDVILALLRGQPDPRFVTQPAVRISLRPAPVRVRYAAQQSADWRAAA